MGLARVVRQSCASQSIAVPEPSSLPLGLKIRHNDALCPRATRSRALESSCVSLCRDERTGDPTRFGATKPAVTAFSPKNDQKQR